MGTFAVGEGARVDASTPLPQGYASATRPRRGRPKRQRPVEVIDRAPEEREFSVIPRKTIPREPNHYRNHTCPAG